ncbi:MAG: PilZ domain-containing protein [Candidatus Omnitrophota bacterium]
MRIQGHVAISLVVGSILYNISHSLGAVLSFLATSILIDIDHYIDYIREYGLSIDPKKIYRSFTNSPFKNFKKITLIFHSYEILILLCLAISVFNLNIVWRYAATGLMLHLFIDQMTNSVSHLSYFLLFRISNQFNVNKIFVKDKERDMYIDKGNRLLERIKTDLAVRYSPQGSDKEFCSTSTDISRGGIRMTLLKKLNPGTMLDLEIFKYNNEAKARCRGKIIWISNGDLDTKNNGFFEAGIQFIDKRLSCVEDIINNIRGGQ